MSDNDPEQKTIIETLYSKIHSLSSKFFGLTGFLLIFLYFVTDILLHENKCEIPILCSAVSSFANISLALGSSALATGIVKILFSVLENEKLMSSFSTKLKSALSEKGINSHVYISADFPAKEIISDLLNSEEQILKVYLIQFESLLSLCHDLRKTSFGINHKVLIEIIYTLPSNKEHDFPDDILLQPRYSSQTLMDAIKRIPLKTTNKNFYKSIEKKFQSNDFFFDFDLNENIKLKLIPSNSIPTSETYITKYRAIRGFYFPKLQAFKSAYTVYNRESYEVYKNIDETFALLKKKSMDMKANPIK